MTHTFRALLLRQGMSNDAANAIVPLLAGVSNLGNLWEVTAAASVEENPSFEVVQMLVAAAQEYASLAPRRTRVAKRPFRQPVSYAKSAFGVPEGADMPVSMEPGPKRARD